MKKFVLGIGLIVLLLASFSVFAQMGGGMMGGQGQMMGQDGPQNQQMDSAGAKIFRDECAACHPNGGNIVVPGLPVSGSRVLLNLRVFEAFIRSPKMPDGSAGSMPAFAASKISDQQARQLFHFVKSAYGTEGDYSMGPGMMRGYGYGMGPGMMGGYGMGPGMMRGYGMGPGMMGGYGMGYGSYDQTPECRKFYDDTAKQRKELHDKRFEYFEAVRNPKTTMEKLSGMQKEIADLQDKIYEKAPAACR